MDRSGIGHSSLRPRGGQRTFRFWLVVGFFGFILIQKVVVAWQLGTAPSLSPTSGLDTTAYAELAQRVLQGDVGLGPGLYYVSPFYIYFLAAALKIAGSFLGVRILQAALGTLAIYLMYQTARLWFNERAALATLVLAGFTGLFTFYEGLILQTSVDVLLTSAALFALSRGLIRHRALPSVLAGVLLGLQTLNRPNMVLAAAGVIALVAIAREWRVALALAAGMAAGLAPAAARNIVVSGEFSPLSSHGGLNFYIGNGEGATGFYRSVAGITPTIQGQARDTRAVAARALGHPVSDAEASNYFRDLALGWMRAHPAAALWLSVRKLGWVFHAQHIPLPYSYPFYERDWGTWLRALIIGPWLLIPLGLVGLAFAAPSPPRRRAYWLWAAFVPAYALAVAAFFMSERYRLPLLVPLAIGAGAAVDFAIARARAHEWRRLALPGTLFLALAAVVNLGAVADDGRWQEGLRVAQQLAIEHRPGESDQWVARLERTASRPGKAELEIGRQYLVIGDLDRARQHLTSAAASDPASAAAQYLLGQTLLGAGDPRAAIPLLRRGLDAGFNEPMAGYDLASALRDVGDTAGALAVLPRIAISAAAPASESLRVGRLAIELGAPETAEQYFRAAVLIEPANADAQLQLGVNLVMLGRHEAAAAQLREAVRLAPANPSALASLGYAELKLGRVDLARAHAAAALALDPSEPMARQLAAAIK